mmetsp:Transcript_65207/g.185099  ORF Transcript_65207/g.185099 Transcript_65207/m.185099 type:complete len:285 (-) Transcript_65207:1071-1925(-)
MAILQQLGEGSHGGRKLRTGQRVALGTDARKHRCGVLALLLHLRLEDLRDLVQPDAGREVLVHQARRGTGRGRHLLREAGDHVGGLLLQAPCHEAVLLVPQEGSLLVELRLQRGALLGGAARVVRPACGGERRALALQSLAQLLHGPERLLLGCPGLLAGSLHRLWGCVRRLDQSLGGLLGGFHLLLHLAELDLHLPPHEVALLLGQPPLDLRQLLRGGVHPRLQRRQRLARLRLGNLRQPLGGQALHRDECLRAADAALRLLRHALQRRQGLARLLQGELVPG